jgi:integrase/recombinase XerC
MQFERYLNEVYLTYKVGQVTDQMIRSWLAEMIEEGLSAKTVNRKISTLRSFFRYLMRQSVISVNPAIKIQGPKQKKRLPVYVEERKMDILFSRDIDFGSFSELRDLLVMEFFYATGVRRAELIGLRLQDVYFDEKQVKVLGKRNKERIIPIGDHLLPLLKSYLELREEVLSADNDTDLVFLTEKGKKMYPKLVYRIVNSYLSTVSTQDKKSPHVLRHTFATHMLNNGADLNAVKELLGHASLAATQIYTHNTIEKLKMIYQQAHPKA